MKEKDEKSELLGPTLSSSTCSLGDTEQTDGALSLSIFICKMRLVLLPLLLLQGSEIGKVQRGSLQAMWFLPVPSIVTKHIIWGE